MVKQGFTIEKVVRRRRTSQKSGTPLAVPAAPGTPPLNPLTHSQTLTHQISLLAGFRTFNNPFRQKTKKEPILQHCTKDLFH